MQSIDTDRIINKVEMTEISLKRREGFRAIHEGITSWEEAQKIISQWTCLAPDDGSYHKCDFYVAFADGNSLSFRFDLTSTGLNIAWEVKKFIIFRSGEYIPSYMTEQQYRNYLQTFKVDTAYYKQLLDIWVIPGI